MKKGLLTNVFVIYLGIVAALTIVPTHLSGLRLPDATHINLFPLRSSLRCYRYALDARSGLRSFCLINLIGNIALFLPLGLLLPRVNSNVQRLRQVFLIALCLSVGIETVQFVLRFVGNPRAVDIDDVILNTFGACLGFALFRFSTTGSARRQNKSQ